MREEFGPGQRKDLQEVQKFFAVSAEKDGNAAVPLLSVCSP